MQRPTLDALCANVQRVGSCSGNGHLWHTAPILPPTQTSLTTHPLTSQRPPVWCQAALTPSHSIPSSTDASSTLTTTHCHGRLRSAAPRLLLHLSDATLTHLTSLVTSPLSTSPAKPLATSTIANDHPTKLREPNSSRDHTDHHTHLLKNPELPEP